MLLAFLAASLSILVSLFVQARVEGAEGERLTQAVALAQNAAEEFAADPAGAQGMEVESDGLVATVQVSAEAHEAGSLLNATVTVVDERGSASFSAGEEACRLSTARYVPGYAADAAGGAAPDAGAAGSADDAEAPAAGGAASGDGSGVE